MEKFDDRHTSQLLVLNAESDDEDERKESASAEIRDLNAEVSRLERLVTGLCHDVTELKSELKDVKSRLQCRGKEPNKADTTQTREVTSRVDSYN